MKYQRILVHDVASEPGKYSLLLCLYEVSKASIHASRWRISHIISGNFWFKISCELEKGTFNNI